MSLAPESGPAGWLEDLLKLGEIRAVDYFFTRHLQRLFPQTPASILAIFASLSRAMGDQHSCIDLASLCGKQVFEGNGPMLADLTRTLVDLRQHPAVGEPGRAAPLVLEGHRLYLHRFHQQESFIASSLIKRNRPLQDVDLKRLKHGMEKYFPASATDNTNWQKVAAAIALTRRLAIITGGPGTGKTSTVIRVIAMILDQQPQSIIRLAAPTGKAANRLAATMQATLADPAFPIPGEIRDTLPAEVQTLHRLLGIRADGRLPRYHAGNPLALNVLIVDEASMIDQALMSSLLSALPEQARLILLGDPDQLPAVETGNLLQDICFEEDAFDGHCVDIINRLCGTRITPADPGSLLKNAVCRLKQGYRFSADQGIGRIAEIVCSGLADEISTIPGSNLRISEGIEGWLPVLYRRYQKAVAAFTDPGDLSGLLASFDSTRILAPGREGKLGVIKLNEMVETGWPQAETGFYHGRPIMITRNDYNLRLFNGDTGVCFTDPTDGQQKVAFPGDSGTPNIYLCARLPPHETCFAMTVHKSQGSEYHHVILVLPDDLESVNPDLMTREMLYTGITRTRREITLVATEAVLKDCIERRGRRVTGLARRLEVRKAEQLTLFD